MKLKAFPAAAFLTVSTLALAGVFSGMAARADQPSSTAQPPTPKGAATSPIAAPSPSVPDPALAISNEKERGQMEKEEKEGKEAADQIAKTEKFDTSSPLSTRVQTIGGKIAAIADTQVVKAGFGNSQLYPFHYTYHIIISKDINAFSLPGGYIYIYQGLLDHLTTDDQIAGVLGHETAHAAHHHVEELMHDAGKMDTQMALGALAAVLAHVPLEDLGTYAAGAQYVGQAMLNNHFSEAAEEDADHTGMIYMLKAGYNPVGMLALLQQLKAVEDASPDIQEGFLQDHPLTSQRLVSARAELASLGYPVDIHSLRVTSGTMIANVVDQGAPGHFTESDVCLGNKIVFRLAGANHDAAQAAANKLNQLLDNNLQLYEVKSDGPDLIARDQPLIAFTGPDTKVQSPTSVAALGPPTPNTIAADAAKTLRTLLWAQTVNSIPEQQIDVGSSPSAMPYPE